MFPITRSRNSRFYAWFYALYCTVSKTLRNFISRFGAVFDISSKSLVTSSDCVDQWSKRACYAGPI